MLTAKELIDIYISFFEKAPRSHKRIANSPLVPENDPTTLFTSSGMQPLIQYLLGEQHPQGTRLVNVQNSFRAQDIEEVGDNRHTTFFRMLGNWSLGDYFKKEEIPWLWEFLTVELGLLKEKLFITVFKGEKEVPYDKEAYDIWSEVLRTDNLEPRTKIFAAGVDKNWWSRSGIPDNMPVGEPGGPDSEVYYRFDDPPAGEAGVEHNKECKDNPVDCECGKFLEIANAVFMQYRKSSSAKASEGQEGFENLPKQNVDFGGGLERLLAAVENKKDIFQTSLFAPVIKAIENETGKEYQAHKKEMQIIADHFAASIFITANGITPSKTEQGYILRRLLRRAFDNFKNLGQGNIEKVLEKIVEQYSQTDEVLKEKYEDIKNVILEEKQAYEKTVSRATKIVDEINISKGSNVGMEIKEITADDAFKMYTTHGLSPSQIKSLGYIFNEQDFAEKMKEHKDLSRSASSGMFKGGLADTSEQTIMGHTATHLLHQALRDVLGNQLHQTGSNITTERVRFDFNYDKSLTAEELKKVEDIVNKKIEENLPVHFEIMPLQKAKEMGAIGLFDDKYTDDVKVYFVGPSAGSGQAAYSKEFCGGPHVDFTGKLKRFKIIKQDNIGHGQRRIYAVVNK